MSLALKEQYDKIYYYCYFKVKNTQLAEDLTQETFLKFFSQSTYISRGKRLAYLYTIAKHLCIDTYRKTITVPLPESSEDMSAKQELAALEAHISITQALDTLPQDLQEIIFLRFTNDLSMLEISRITGLSRFAIYRKINSALGQLKLMIREEDFS